VQAGYAIIKGFLWGTDSTDSVNIAAASAHDRIDRLVLRLNRSAGSAAADIQPVIIAGTASTTPVPPSLLSSAQFQDLLIAQWTSKADGSFTAVQDLRQFCGTPVVVFTSTSRPLNPPRPMIGIETNTGALAYWNGSQWSYITPSFGQDTDILTGDQRLPTDGTVQQIATVSFIGDGSTHAMITFSVPAFYRPVNGNDQNAFTFKNAPAAVITCFHSAIVEIRIDGNVVDRRWVSIPGTAGDSVRVSGLDMVFKTSDAGHTTPSAGNHTVNIKAWAVAGNRDIWMVADPSYPIRLHVSPVFE
jgi:hypothetical protein